MSETMGFVCGAALAAVIAVFAAMELYRAVREVDRAIHEMEEWEWK